MCRSRPEKPTQHFLLLLLVVVALTSCDSAPQDDLIDAPGSPGGFTAVRPVRRLDTRASARPASRSTVCVQVAGRAGVPSSAVAVAVNLTAVAPAGTGFLTAYPKGAGRPGTSNVNYRPGKTTAGGAIVKVGGGGAICVYVQTAADVLIDVTGYFGSNTAFSPVGPFRRLDTRTSARPAAGSTRCFQVAGRGGVPGDARAVAINLTAVQASDRGYLTVYPKGSRRPGTSNVNYARGGTIANGAIAQVGDSGSICVYTHAATDYIVDLAGYFGAGSDYRPLPPYRRLDTRNGSRPGSGTTRCVKVAGRNGVPGTAKAVAINLTAVAATDTGFLTAFPEGTSRPGTSNINYAAGQTRANNAIVQVGNQGFICVYVHSAVDFLIDVAGYWQGTASDKLQTWGWDYNLTHRCVASPVPGQANFYRDDADCPEPGKHWSVSNQAEKQLQQTCTGPLGQSLPINAGGPLTLSWSSHRDEMGRSNLSAILKTDLYNHAHPCGPGAFTWYAFMDHRDNGGGPFPTPDKATFHGTVWYNDWTPNGQSRVIAGWSGDWDGKGVIIEIDLQSANWGDAYPDVPDIVQAIDHPNFQWVEMDGRAMGLSVPRQRETPITIYWPDIIRDLIRRGYLIGPTHGLASGNTSSLSLATEVGNHSTAQAAIAEMRVSNFRIWSR